MSVDWDLKHQLTRTDTREHDHEIPQSQTLVYLCRLLHQENNTFNKSEKCSGKLVEHLNWDRSAASSKLTGDTVLCPKARHIILCLVLVQPRRTRKTSSINTLPREGTHLHEQVSDTL